VNVENEDGSGFAIACGNPESLVEYNDGDSIVFYITKTEEQSVGKLEVLPTIEKHVSYPRQSTVDGVQYPYVYVEDGENDVPVAIVKTSRGWTIGGTMVAAQHAENVAVDKANCGGTMPTEISTEAKAVLFVVNNLREVIELAKNNPGTSINVDEKIVSVTSADIHKQSTKPNVFGGAVISKAHDPELAHGWYSQQPNEDDKLVFDWLFRALYGVALKQLNLLPQEVAA
jgi:hypothetical protein